MNAHELIESLELRRLFATSIANPGGPYTLGEGSSITLDGSQSILGTNPNITFEWDLEYDGTSFQTDSRLTRPIFNSTYLDGPLTKTVALRVRGSDGTSAIATTTVSVTNAAPTAVFSSANDSLPLGNGAFGIGFTSVKDPSSADYQALKFSIDANNDGDFTDPGDVADYSVDPSFLLNRVTPVTVFNSTQVGAHTVRGRITDKDGGFNDYTVTVTVTEPTVYMEPLSPFTVAEGGYVDLFARGGPLSWAITPNATSSYGNYYSFDWDLNYDSVTFKTDQNTNSQGIRYYEKTRDSGSTRTIAFRMKYRVFGVDYAKIETTTLTVTNAPPTATFNTTGGASLGTASTIQFVNATDGSPADVAAGFKYSFDLNNDGDFTDAAELANTSTPTLTHLFPAIGNYTVHGRITDKDGGFTDYTTPVAVNPAVLTAKIIGPLTVTEGSSVQLDGSLSSDPDGAISKYEWDFDYNGSDFSSSGDLGPNPTYSPHLIDDGPVVRQIALRVTGANGDTTIATTTVTVTNIAPTGYMFFGSYPVIGQPFLARISAFDTSSQDEQNFRYSFDFNNDGDFTDPGDVLNELARPPKPYNEKTISAAYFTYLVAGPQTIHGRVTDDDGGYFDAYLNIVVQTAPLAAVADPGLQYLLSVAEGSSLVLDGSHSYEVGGAPITDYEWDFNYDGVNFEVDATGAKPTFDASGIDGTVVNPDGTSSADRRIALRVKGTNGTVSPIADTYIYFYNIPPTATLTPTGDAVIGSPATIEFINPTDSPGDRAAGFKYSFDFNQDGDYVDPGDVLNSTSPVASFKFTTAGKKPVAGRIMDKDGAFTTLKTTVNVNAVTGAAVTGNVFSDGNKNGKRDAAEAALPNITVWIDLDGDKTIDLLETTTTTDALGNYLFSNVPSTGSNVNTRIRAKIPTGATQILPGSGYGYAVTLTKGYSNTLKDFALYVPVITPPSVKGSIRGFLFADTNNNGKFDAVEALQVGKAVFIDLDGDGVLDANELSVKTDSKGAFSFNNLSAGTYKIRRVIPTGYKVTTAPLNISLSAGQVISGVSIGSKTI